MLERSLQFAHRWSTRKKQEKKMKVRTSLVLLLFSLLAAGALAQDSAFMGTWKLDEGKSKFPAGAGKNTTVTYEPSGDQVKITVEGTAADGKAVNDVWTGKFDGKDYPTSGDNTLSESRAYKMVNNHTLTFTAKRNGKVITNGRVSVSADGKTRTVTSTTTDANGKKISSTAVYEKQM
jgi:hypothetical protein